MSGFGYGNKVPQTAKDVAAAFYAGKACRRSNCFTDGYEYTLCATVLARRLHEDYVPLHVALAIQGKRYRRPLEFTFGGWATQMTCRHLEALGVKARIQRAHRYGPRGGVGDTYYVPLMNGREVDPHAWYTLDELNAMPRWHHPVWVPSVSLSQFALA